MVLQEVSNANVLPATYQSIVSIILVLLATIIGRKKAQPELNPEPTVLGFASLPDNTITFEQAFERLIGHEAGYTNLRSDPGNWTGGVVGKGQLKGTKYGIAANTYPHIDIKNLTLAEAKEIYRRDWWEKLGAEQLHSAIVFQLWDFAVNAGKAELLKNCNKSQGFRLMASLGPKQLLQ